MNKKEVKNFFYNISEMLKSEIDLLQAIDIYLLRNKQRSVLNFKKDLEKGLSIKDAISHISKSNEIKNMISLIEITGNVKEIFSNVYIMLDKKEKIRNNFLSIFTYPIIILFINLCIVSLLLIFVVPKFVSVFNDLNVDLPISTKILIFLSRHILIIFLLTLLLAIFLIFLSSFLYKKYRILFDKTFLLFPYYKQKICLEVIFYISFLLNMEISLDKTLEILKVNNEYVNLEIQKKVKEIRRGKQNLSFSFFDVESNNLLYIAHKSNNYKMILNKMYKLKEDEYQKNIKAFSQILEPLLLIFVSSIVFFVVLSISIPLFSLPSYF